MLTTMFLIPIGCADVTPIEDGRALGSVETLKDWFTSAYLLPDPDGGAILIDAGWRHRRLRRALADRGYAPGDVTDVLLTHGHGDHLGGLEILTGAQVHALEAEADLIREEGGLEIDAPLTDGQALSLGGYTIEVFAVPGHTAGSAVFLVDGVLILGDSALIQAGGGLAPVPEDRSDDPALLEDSLRALAAALEPRADEIDWLAPAHSGPSEGLGALLDYAGL